MKPDQKSQTPRFLKIVLDPPILALLLASIFFIFILIWSESHPQATLELMTASATQTTEAILEYDEDYPTPYPPELLASSEQTNGIVFGGVLLVLIVVAGTLAAIRRKG